VNGSPASTHPEPTPNPAHTPSHTYAQTPGSIHNLESPTTTPTKTIKALPTVRDHTTDQLNPEGDEFIIREVDENGDKKVSPNGSLLGGRQYKTRIFHMPKHGDKFFMLATECAKVLGYRDSYLLFNKNRSLFKIIANQEEKNDLIDQGVLPASYRSRQIAIVSARSMYRQFGSRMVMNGRRVRDDYWEAKAIKQGFTEEDAAGEKRPGAGRARESHSENTSSIQALPHGQIIYQPTTEGPKSNTYINLEPVKTYLDYSTLPRVRQDIPPIPYEDRLQPSPQSDLLSHVTHGAEYNQSVANQRRSRAEYLNDIWQTQHEPDSTEEDAPNESTASHVPSTTQTSHPLSGQTIHDRQPMPHHQPQQAHHPAMLPQHQQYPPNVPPHMLAQSPSRPQPQQLPGGGQIPHPGMGGGYPYGAYPGQMYQGGMPPGAHPGMQQGMQFPMTAQSPHMQSGTPMHAAMGQRNPSISYNPAAAAYGNQQQQFPGQQGQQYMQGQQPGGQQQWGGQHGGQGQQQGGWQGGF
jgi:hypothetical protein